MAICVGCGLNVNGSGVLEVDLADDVAGDGHSGIHCDNTNGLSLQVQHSNTDSILLSGNGTNASPLTATVSVDTQNSTTINWTGGREGTAALPLQAQVTISPDNCNGLDPRGNGLYSPCPQNYTCSNNVGFTGGAIIGVPNGLSSAGAGTFALESQCNDGGGCTSCPGGVNGSIQVCNPYAAGCCNINGFWDVQAYGGFITANPGFSAVFSLEISFDGGAFVGASPSTNFRIVNQGGVPAVRDYDLPFFLEKNFFVEAPGECHTFKARIFVRVDAGTATWVVGPNFEFHWGPLVQVQGCCS